MPISNTSFDFGRGACGACSGVVPLRGYNLKDHGDHVMTFDLRTLRPPEISGGFNLLTKE